MIIYGSRFRDVLFGTSEDDTIYGYDGNDDLLGGNGDDHLFGGIGADVINGGAGRDWACYDDAAEGVYVVLITGAGYAGEAAGDVLIEIENLSGSAFADVLIGDTGINYINGNGGNDLIFGLDGIDVLHGGLGDDQIWGGTARDYIYGDEGFDFVRYDYAESRVDVRLDEPSFIGSGGGWAGEALDDSLFGIEGVVGSKFDDHLAGSVESNVLMGLDGNDELLGKGGDDMLFGGEGQDLLDGGTGFDYARYDDAGMGVVVSLAAGLGFGGAALGDRLVGIEGLTGSQFDDTFVGDGNGNVLFGFDGRDNLQGGGGADALLGGNGDDLLDGGADGDYIDGGDGFDVASYQGAATGVAVDLGFGLGSSGEAVGDWLVSIEGAIGSTHADTLTGNGGDNMLRGHEGADTLTGAWGNDRFLWERNDLLGAARDVVTDFGVTAGDNDMLVFHDLTAADIVLSSDPMGTRISVSDPAFGGDILVMGRSPAELAGHLLFT
jgi:Ca2+-binding RTX toxin-like protein